MANKNKHPVDAYAKAEFEEGVETLQKFGVPYEPRSVERDQSADWQTTHAASTDNERAVLTELDRLYTNAQREAIKENEKIDSRKIAAELMPRIEEMKKETEEVLGQIADLPPATASLGRAVVTEAEEAHRMIKSESHSRLGEIIVEIFVRIKELYRRFKELVGSFFALDRFGRGKDDGLHGVG